jgi:hypothetical protein
MGVTASAATFVGAGGGDIRGDLQAFDDPRDDFADRLVQVPPPRARLEEHGASADPRAHEERQDEHQKRDGTRQAAEERHLRPGVHPPRL